MLNVVFIDYFRFAAIKYLDFLNYEKEVYCNNSFVRSAARHGSGYLRERKAHEP